MKNKLYVIGNGFDLYHGLKTGVDDFKKISAKKYIITRLMLWICLSEVNDSIYSYQPFLKNLIQSGDAIINFNYTLTIEELYKL